ncbi:hypothetical protein B5E84_09705 [Lachnoclostridium sp. An14]|uniref:hypothetical protein n=1 Tax=Lachnoclostridium sp. An14 TaxID=1965562 RepID=UPI000B3A2381|nr:hypothetical protein [Lachnoclostridium sp. An14]OUQ17601.1 hypothetical protein B5E84_09705 [Lachnoclostridium sp. An14]
MGVLARTDISASDGQDGMRKEGDSPYFEYRRQMAGTPQAWSHLAFMIRDDRVSGHVRFMSGKNNVWKARKIRTFSEKKAISY